MHSFASALIAAALVTLTSAAPAGVPSAIPSAPSVPLAVPSGLLPSIGQVSSGGSGLGSATGAVRVRGDNSPSPPSVPLAVPSGLTPSIGQVSSVGGALGSVTGAVRVRDDNSKITDAVTSVQGKISGVHRRDGQLSVAAIFGSVSTGTGPSIEQLNYLVPSNCTVSEVSDIVASIKAPILAVIPELQALVGAELSVILAPIVGTVELTVAEVAALVGAEVDLVLAAAGNVLAVVNTHGGDIVADVEDILADLGCTITDLVGAVLPLVDGLAASLGPVVAPVDAIIEVLQLTELAAELGLSA
jgi:hypothetical protein